MKDEQKQAGWNPDPKLKSRELRPFNRLSFNEAAVQLDPNINISHPSCYLFFFIFKHKGSTAAPTADRCHKGSQLLTDSLAAC